MVPDSAKHSEKFYYFYQVAQTGSMHATARKLGIAANTVSQSIKQLESVLGVLLFRRHKNGVELTEQGKSFYDFCENLYQNLSDLERRFSSSTSDLRKIRFGTFPSIALYFWPLLIRSLPATNKLSLSLTTSRSKLILESLVSQQIDVALTVGSPQHKRLLSYELYKDDYCFFASSRLKTSTLTKSDLTEHTLVFIPDAEDDEGRSLRSYVQSWSYRFKDECELDSFDVAAEFIKSGYGIGILPVRVAKRDSRTLHALQIDDQPTQKFGTHRFFLSHRDDLELPQKFIKKILDAAKAAAKQL